jgi:hypothetical protein
MIRQPSRSARGTWRATIRRTGGGHCARRAARHHLPARHRPPAVALGARRNTIRRLLALSGVSGRTFAISNLLSKSWRDRFECLESTFDS